MYDVDSLRTIEINFYDSNFNNVLDSTYFNDPLYRLPAQITFNNITLDSVAVRYKGNSSYTKCNSALKKPYNIDFNQIVAGQKLMGYKKMKLSNSYFDPTFIKELLATKIYQRYLPTYETNLLKVYTQGTYTGLYVNQEAINKQFLLKHFSDIAIVWAKNEEGRIKGLIVERGMDGFTTPETHGKWSLRASATGELVFDNVKVPKQNLLPNKDGLGAPLGCLDSARYGIAWGAIGAAMDCYDTALRYSKERHQFGKPIGSFQLQQKKLAEMITEITKAQFLTWRLGVLKNEDRASTAQISMCKRNNVDMALKIARESRQILGGMGITGDYPIMRHMMNLESVVTYEGTHDIHLLITGLDITGLNAFK